jgi:broad specificity phosphatase PhoE
MAATRVWASPKVLIGLIVLLLVCLLGSGYFLFLRPLTTVILVRHAEKNIEPNNPDPDLSPAGQGRAQELVHILGSKGITAIYATQYHRTQQTARPLAERLGLPVTQIDAANSTELVRRIRSDNPGGVVFVVGHNNTVPQTVNALSGGSLPVIPENEFDNMYVVTLYRFRSAKVVRTKYGATSTTGGGSQTMVP